MQQEPKNTSSIQRLRVRNRAPRTREPIPEKANQPLACLAVPMYLENILRPAISCVDVFMVSAYSAKAVAAVGLINQFSFFILLLYTMVGSGVGILVSQYLGARKEREAGDAGIAGIVLVSLFALFASIICVSGARSLLGLYDLEPEVNGFAWQYLIIWGGGSFFMALNVVQGTILRTHGFPRDTMWTNMVANLCNVLGNAIALYGLFGLPVTGVAGVAASTVVSQAIACAILALIIRRRKEIVLPWRDLLRIPGAMYRKLLSIGVPTAGENISYSLMQLVIIGFIAKVGTDAMNAHVYTNTILQFVFMPAFTIGAAGQIKVGYLVGALRFADAEKNAWRYYMVSLVLSMAFMSVCWLFRGAIVGIFTHDAAIAVMVASLFLISFFRESGRISNIVLIPALKGSGDVVFPVLCALFFMWLVGAGGAWLLGLKMGLGLAGVWIAIAADEWLRGIAIMLRWRSGIWKKKSLVHHDPEPPRDE